MKTESIKMVLVRWTQVEDGDQIWHDGKLFEVMSDPYPNDDDDINLSSNWMKIDVRNIEPEGYWDDQSHGVYIDMNSRVAVVTP